MGSLWPCESVTSSTCLHTTEMPDALASHPCQRSVLTSTRKVSPFQQIRALGWDGGRWV